MGEGWTDVSQGEDDPLPGILEKGVDALGRIAIALERIAALNRQGFAPVGEWDENEIAGCEYFDEAADLKEEQEKARKREMGY